MGRGSLSPAVKLLVALGLVVLILTITALDVTTAERLRLRVPYIIPIGLGAALLGFRAAAVLSILALAGDLATSLLISNPFTAERIGAAIFRFFSYFFVAFLIDRAITQLRLIREFEKRRDTELKIAKEAQRSMLGPPTVILGNLTAYYKLTFARELGGDYVHIARKNDSLIFCMADISGKSVSAGLFSMVLHQNLTEILHDSQEPASVVNTLNERLYSILPEDMFITLFFGVISDSWLNYINAGHELPLIFHRGDQDLSIIGLDQSVPLGIYEKLEANSRREEFQEGDILLAVTDGVSDSPYFKDQTISKLSEILNHEQATEPEDIVNRIHDLAAPEPATIRDDVAIACVKRS